MHTPFSIVQQRCSAVVGYIAAVRCCTEHCITTAILHRSIADTSTTVNNVYTTGYTTRNTVYCKYQDGTKSRVNYGFDEINAEWPGKLARICDEVGVRQLIHVSAMAADASSKSTWARTKAQGELEVKREFPDATIVRPGKMFGDEDRLLNWVSPTVYILPLKSELLALA
jgi:hypothetical protein